MHKGNVKWWVLAAALMVTCPSFFCGAVGLNAFFDTSGGSSFVTGVIMLCVAVLPWLLPAGVWWFGNGRSAPVTKSGGDGDSSAEYSPFHTDPYHDADSAMQDSGDDF